MNHDLDMEKFQLSSSIVNYLRTVTHDTLKLYFLSMQYDKYLIEANLWNKKDLKNQLILTEIFHLFLSLTHENMISKSLKIYFSILSLCDQQNCATPLAIGA